jgi:two-component system NtrC family sensor kinase
VRLVPKLALALFAGVFVVVAAYTAWRVRSDISSFDQDARRDQRVVGITAAAALAKTRLRDDAIRLAHRVDASRELIRVRYVSLDATAPDAQRPILRLPTAERPAAGGWKQLVRPRAGTEAADLLITYVPAPVADDELGAMELSQPLASATEYAWRGVWSALASSLAMVLVGGTIMAVIGARVVGHPIAELIDAARRIGEGDFEALKSSERRDELGELARAMKLMSQDLAEERRRSRAEAEARIHALEQLRHADRLATLGQLASVLAHEMGTPLNVIAGHGKMIESGRLGAAAVHESASAIAEQCGRITGLVRRVLDYARRSPPKRAALDARAVVRTTKAMLQGLAMKRDVQLELDDGDGLPLQVFGDTGQLQQALTNIVLNAVHASSAGATVHIAVDHTTRMSSGKPKSFVVFTVRDTGGGIDPQMAERVFEPFFTTKSPGEGTGLGLSIARDIVEEHGGFIALSSSGDAGTTFEIGLPLEVEE